MKNLCEVIYIFISLYDICRTIYFRFLSKRLEEVYDQMTDDATSYLKIKLILKKEAKNRINV